MKDVVIVGALRTPIGCFQGTLSRHSAVELGSLVVKALVERTGIDPQSVDEVILGQVLTAGTGQNPARQSAIRGGLPNTVSAITINDVCGSGLKALHLATLGGARVLGRDDIGALAPGMSALILLSHVKKGTELAERYKLGQDIADIISQHHGTRLIRFFYQKALNLGEKPRESDFSYLGPRPQTKEAAILMLADSVEASSRTLSDPTPARIKTHIDTIMKGIFSEGQLDESKLTFKDLHKLSESFARILTGLFHQRIAYPDLNKDKKTASDKPEQAKVQAKPEEKTEQRPDVKRTVAYAASSVMPGSSGAAAPNGPEQQGAAPAAPHTPVPPSANPGPPIDLVYPVVPGPPKPVNKGPLSMKPVGKRP